ncbi:AAA family ATPase [Kineococcus sp. NPDC059986]|uniref:AAA family ATPase n=1 Tax=Kineococcus sp. NPDC059986 TaxID=3155538 RepID=UPI00344B4E24
MDEATRSYSCGPATPVATYPYHDAQGKVVVTKTRFAPKSFSIEPAGVLGAMGEKYLYRLPEVLAAAARGEVVLVTEGEKDADAARALGYTATCNIEGASKAGASSKWRPEYTAQLKGARVRVVQDRDAAGQGHAASIVQRLVKANIPCEILESRSGKDLSDHLDAGYAIEELAPVALTDDCADVGPLTAEDSNPVGILSLADVEVEPVHWLWPGYLPAGKLVVVEGDPSASKSSGFIDLMARVTVGAPWPDGQVGTAPGVVMLLSAEDGLGDTIKPRFVVAGADEANVKILTSVDIASAGEVASGRSSCRATSGTSSDASESSTSR